MEKEDKRNEENDGNVGNGSNVGNDSSHRLQYAGALPAACCPDWHPARPAAPRHILKITAVNFFMIFPPLIQFPAIAGNHPYL